MCPGIVHIPYTCIRTHFHAYAYQHTCLCARTQVSTHTQTEAGLCDFQGQCLKYAHCPGGDPSMTLKASLPCLTPLSGQEDATFLANLKGSFHTPTDPSPCQRKALQPGFPDWLLLAEMTAGHIPIRWETDPVPRQDDHHKQFSFFP